VGRREVLSILVGRKGVYIMYSDLMAGSGEFLVVSIPIMYAGE
jgi:hypothetical protein